MRPIWKGAISFGLVNIPVSLFPGTKSRQQVEFDMLRQKDLSRIRYKRVAEADNEEVPYEDIVKGYEYEKGNYVVVTKEDFQRVAIKSSQVVDIKEFVDLDDVDPRYFDEPYFLAPEKGGAKAYVLLREALTQTGKAGIAKVVLRPPREKLAVVKPLENILVLETMHFADELRDASELQVPDAEVGRKELDMAVSLVSAMADKWKPEKYKDEYREALMELIEEKIKSGGKSAAGAKTKAPSATRIVDLASVLEQSLKQAQGGTQRRKREGEKRRKGRKVA
jgi:DNA end-binding protein Ku